MHRCSSGFFLAITTITFAIALTGCLGKSTPNASLEGVESVSLSPSFNFSMDIGGILVFSASAKNASGGIVLGTIQFLVASGTQGVPAPLSVASNGNACAGTWDAAVAICTAGAPGIALVTAIVNGVSSPPTTVYVHQHIDNLQVIQAETQPPQYDCFSQGQTWVYKGIAYSNGLDITNTVGQLNWASTNAGVLTTNTNPPVQPPLPLNQVQITAVGPGITQLYAIVSGTTSNSLPITTCLVQSVRLRTQGNGNSVSVNNGSAVPLQATVVDTLGYTLTKPPLTWSTNNPEVVSFTSTTSSTGINSATARANLGGADVTASCTPPTCSIGVLPGLPIYASNGSLPNGQQGYGTISINVTTNSMPGTYAAWAATDQCQNVIGCTSVMFSLLPTQGGTNPIGVTVTVPRTPNSLMFNHSSRAYLGSEQGLMYVDVSGSSGTSVTPVSSATTPCNVSLCGTLLAISNDGKQVVVSDNVSATPQVYIYNSAAGSGTNPATDLVLPNVATAAAFSPDQSKIFIVTNAGTMYVYSTVDALAPVPIPTSGTNVAFSADGSFAYVAGSAGSAGSVSAFSTCSLPGIPSVELGAPVATSGVPLQIFPSPNLPPSPPNSNLITQNVLVLEPPNVQVLTAQFTQTDINNGQVTCPPNLASFAAGPSYNLGQGGFTPIYARLAGDGSQLIMVGQNIPAVLIFNVASGTTTSVRMGRDGYPNTYPLSASSSSDGSQVYVAACDQYQNNDPSQPCLAGSVHLVSTTGEGDYQQVPYINNTTNNMCNTSGGTAPPCIPDLVAIKPQ